MVYTFVAGQKLTASVLNAATMPGNLVARHVRTTDSATTTSTTGIGFIFLDVPVVSGRVYWIGAATPVHHNSSVTTDNIMSKITHTTNGSTPTASSTVLDGAQAFSVGVPIILGTTYEAAFTGTLKTLMCVARASGSGNAHLVSSSGRSIHMVAYDIGLPAGGGSNA